ncbi:MAG: hypothetical protein HY978_01945 [Candidatus Liptonbacteria bacterium]|nr:hypothetical protein [Candidatus Liptonbacteria bacterium]
MKIEFLARNEPNGEDRWGSASLVPDTGGERLAPPPGFRGEIRRCSKPADCTAWWPYNADVQSYETSEEEARAWVKTMLEAGFKRNSAGQLIHPTASFFVWGKLAKLAPPDA